MEEMQRMGRYDLLYKKVKMLSKKPRSSRCMAVKDKMGNLLQKLEDVRHRWKEYIEELFRKDERPEKLDVEDSSLNIDDIVPEILKDEVSIAIQ